MGAEGSATKPVAALDIGSNSIKLLVAERDTVGLRVLFNQVEVTRLAQDLGVTGRLRPDAMARTLDAVGRLIDAAAVEPQAVHAIVTAPGRRAANASELLDALQERFAISANIVTGEREAALSQLATRRAFPELDPVVAIDLGGASTELVRSQGAETTAMVSVDIGSVLLTEQCLSVEPPSATDLVSARHEAQARYAPHAAPFREGAPDVVILGGTATTTAMVHHGLPGCDAQRLHRIGLPRHGVTTVVERLAALSLAERMRLGMSRGRAEVILGGAVLIEALMMVLERDDVWISDHGARWGLAWAVLESSA